MNRMDDEVRSWSEAWKSSATGGSLDAANIRREVKRRTLRYRAFLALETVFLTLMLGWLLSLALTSSDPYDRAMVAAFVLLILASFARGAHIVRRTWRPRSETTAAFIELMIRRAETSLAQLRLGWAVLAFELAVFIPWIHHTLEASGRSGSSGAGLLAWGFLASLASAACLWLLIARRRALADLNRWQSMRGMIQE